jgi:hypothetical protein
MKKIFVLIFVIAVLFGCESSLKNSGEILIKNGKGVETKIAYTCDSCEYLTRESFNEAVEQITKELRETLKFPRSFVPVSLHLDIKRLIGKYYYSDNSPIEGAYTIDYVYKYIANNAYNAEIEGEYEGSTYLTRGGVLDISDLIRLDSLYLTKDDGRYSEVNRSLFVSDEDEYIHITPLIENNIIHLSVKSSFRCVDEGTTISFYVSGSGEFSLKSWNTFNCEGTSFFKLTTKQIEYLKGKEVSQIHMYYKESIFCIVPSNKKDYFSQLAYLIAKKGK